MKFGYIVKKALMDIPAISGLADQFKCTFALEKWLIKSQTFEMILTVRMDLREL